MNYARKVVGNTLVVLLLKVFGVISVMLTNALLARILTQQELGVYFLFASMVMFFSIVVKAGQRQAVVRLVSELVAKHDYAKIIRVTLSAFKIIIVFALCLFILGLVGFDSVLAYIFRTESITTFSFLLFVWILLLSLETPIVETLRGLDKVGIASIFENMFSYVLLALILYILYSNSTSINIKDVVVLTIMCISISLFIGLIALTISLYNYKYIHGSVVSDILIISLPLLLVNLSSFILNNSGIWLSSIFLDQQAVAFYGAAWKFVNVIVFPLTIVNLAIQPIIVHLFTLNKISKLEKILRGSATLLAIPAIFMTVILITFREELLVLVYGEGFSKSAGVFVILTIGQLINVLTGQSMIILGLCGYQNILMKVYVFCTVISVLLSYLLVSQYGVEGIAIGVSVGLATCNITTLYLAYKYVGIKIYATVNLQFIREASRKVLTG